MLGSAGYVECLVVNSEGAESLIKRRADRPDKISISILGAKVAQLSASEEMPFPISILGWHEIEAVADHAEARISLLDRVGHATEIKALYAKMKVSVEQARDLLPFASTANPEAQRLYCMICGSFSGSAEHCSVLSKAS